MEEETAKPEVFCPHHPHNSISGVNISQTSTPIPLPTQDSGNWSFAKRGSSKIHDAESSLGSLGGKHYVTAVFFTAKLRFWLGESLITALIV